MSDLELEALAHQHSHGVWVVGLTGYCIAVFDHPNGKLIAINSNLDDLWEDLEDAAKRHESRRHKPAPQLPDISLEGINL